MKRDTHPHYHEVLFIDSSTDARFLCGTTLKPKGGQVEVYEGKEYPVQVIDVSSSSHPFYTKEKGKFLDSEGRVDKFLKRYAKASKQVAQTAQQATQKPEPPPAKKPKARAKPKSPAT